MRSAVAAGLGLNMFNRQADKLYMCNIAQMVNVLQSVVLTDGPAGKTAIRTTTYWAFMLFKPHRGKMALKIDTDAPPLPIAFAGRGGRGAPQAPKMPELSVSASRSGPELVASFVNPRHDLDMNVDCQLHGATARQARAQILHDPDINACNSFDSPDRLTPKPHEVTAEGDRIRLTVPAMSVATVTVQVT
jgi:alpha-N-arabinofuranosidase